jgi:hypothetical protein
MRTFTLHDESPRAVSGLIEGNARLALCLSLSLSLRRRTSWPRRTFRSLSVDAPAKLVRNARCPMDGTEHACLGRRSFDSRHERHRIAIAIASPPSRSIAALGAGGAATVIGTDPPSSVRAPLEWALPVGDWCASRLWVRKYGLTLLLTEGPIGNGWVGKIGFPLGLVVGIPP